MKNDIKIRESFYRASIPFWDIKKSVTGAIPSVGSLVGSLAKIGTVAGGVGLVATGLQNLVSEAMNAGQNMDNFNWTMQATKDTFATLTQALFNADWSKFSAGVFKANKDLQAMLDTLGDIDLAYEYVTQTANASLTEFREKVGNRKSSQEEKEAAKTKARQDIDEAQGVANDKKKQVDDILNQIPKAKGTGLTGEDMIKSLKKGYKLDDISATVSASKTSAARLDKLRTQRGTPLKELREEEKVYKELQEKIAGYTGEDKKLADVWITMNDKQRQSVKANALAWHSVTNDIAGYNNTYNKIVNKMEGKDDTDTNVKAPATAKEIINPGSIKDFESQIKTLKEKYSNEPDRAIRIKLEADIKDLELQIEKLKNGPGLTKIPVKIEPVTQLRDTTTGQFTPPETLAPIRQDLLTGDAYKPFVNNDVVPSLNEQIQAYGDLGSELGNVALAFNDLAGGSESSAAGIMAVSQTLQGLASALPAIIPMINAISAANKKEQTSAAGAAVAETMKANAGLGPVGWIIGIAAVAAVIATLVSSFSKFAGGGIVPGGSFSGDQVLARLNSGEMVLNRGQQTNLFNMLNEGHRERTSGLAGANNVEFRLRGTELIGLINNTSRKHAI